MNKIKELYYMGGIKTAQISASEGTPIDALRAAGKLTVADEKRFCELDAAMMKRGNPGVRRIMTPIVEEQMRALWAAQARG